MKGINPLLRLEEIETLRSYIPNSKVSQIKPQELSNLYSLIKSFISKVEEDCNLLPKNSNSLTELVYSLDSLRNVRKILKNYNFNNGCEDERLALGIGGCLAELRKNLSKIENIYRSFSLA